MLLISLAHLVADGLGHVLHLLQLRLAHLGEVLIKQVVHGSLFVCWLELSEALYDAFFFLRHGSRCVV
jgi:hypothetical protein